MTKKTRKILFYSSIVLFLIMSTAVVLFALGYGYDFSKNEILKTGGFGVTTNIGASVYINDRLAGTTSFLSDSYSKSRLLPDSYQIRVEGENSRSWQKLIEVNEGAFTHFPAIILLPTELQSELLKTKNLPISISNLYLYKNFFYFLSNGQIISYDLEGGQQKVLVKKVETFRPDGNTLIYRSSDKNFYSFAIGEKTRQLLDLPVIPSQQEPAIAVADFKNIQKFQSINGVTYLITKSGTQASLFLIKNEKTTKIADNVTNFILSPDTGKLLYYNSREVYIFYLKDTGYQPFKIAEQTDLFTRTSRTISDIQWYKDSEHILMNASGNLTFIELDDRGNRNSYDLTDNTKAFYYDSATDAIYQASEASLLKIELH